MPEPSNFDLEMTIKKLKKDTNQQMLIQSQHNWLNQG